MSVAVSPRRFVLPLLHVLVRDAADRYVRLKADDDEDDDDNDVLSTTTEGGERKETGVSPSSGVSFLFLFFLISIRALGVLLTSIHLERGVLVLF